MTKEEQELKHKSTGALEAELKGIRIVAGALIGVLIVLFAAVIYGLLTQEDKTTHYALLTVALSCSAMLPIQYGSMRKIRQELKQRATTKDMSN